MQTFSMLQLSIPKPCHEDWEAMTPNRQGRHCNACAKTVVDFTSMTDATIKNFFLQKEPEAKVCGRFKDAQLYRIKIALPEHIFQLKMPRWKQFLTACLLAFSSMLFSCDVNVTKGEPVGALLIPISTIGSPVAVIDTIPAEKLKEKKVPAECSTLTGDTIFITPQIQGDVSVIPIEELSLDIVDIGPADSNLLKHIPIIKQPAFVEPSFKLSDSAKTKIRRRRIQQIATI